jgi:hypothetical protein
MGVNVSMTVELSWRRAARAEVIASRSAAEPAGNRRRAAKSLPLCPPSLPLEQVARTVGGGEKYGRAGAAVR